MLTIPISALDDHLQGRGPGFRQAVLQMARRKGDSISFTIEEWNAVAQQHAVKPPRIEPPHVAKRDAACEGCDWKRSEPNQRYCDHPARSCAKLFPRAASETCPLGKWESMQTDNNPPRSSGRVAGPDRTADLQASLEKFDGLISALEERVAKLKARRADLAGRIERYAKKAAAAKAAQPANSPTSQ